MTDKEMVTELREFASKGSFSAAVADRLENYATHVAALQEEIRKLTALAQNEQSAIDTNARLAPEIEKLVDERRWMPASSKPEDGRYLVVRFDDVTKASFIDILWFEKGDWWNRHYPGNYRVTHWMPLPALPEAERK